MTRRSRQGMFADAGRPNKNTARGARHGVGAARPALNSPSTKHARRGPAQRPHQEACRRGLSVKSAGPVFFASFSYHAARRDTAAFRHGRHRHEKARFAVARQGGRKMASHLAPVGGLAPLAQAPRPGDPDDSSSSASLPGHAAGSGRTGQADRKAANGRPEYVGKKHACLGLAGDGRQERLQIQMACAAGKGEVLRCIHKSLCAFRKHHASSNGRRTGLPSGEATLQFIGYAFMNLVLNGDGRGDTTPMSIALNALAVNLMGNSADP